MTIKAGIVQKNKFISPGDKRYQAAIDYLDKEQSKRINNLDKFFAFENELATKEAIRMSAIFDGRQDALDGDRKQQLKRSFTKAKKLGSPMWQTVYSFDNDYLKELGLYRMNENNFLDEYAIREAVRVSCMKMIEDMGLGSTAEWGAAIHFDTGNVHAHIMMVSTDPEAVLTKMKYKEKEVYRAKIPPKLQRAMKSKFGNSIANRDPTLARISFMLRTGLVKGSLEKGYADNLRVMRSVSELMSSLPKDRRLWKYGNTALEEFRPQLDSLSKEILFMNQPDGLKELDKLLTEQSDFYLKSYGTAAVQTNDGKTFKDNKMAELYKNLGNALLRDMSAMVSREEWKQKNQYSPEEIQRYLSRRRSAIVTKKDLSRMQAALDETRQDQLNRWAYQEEQRRKEWERKIELEQDNGRSY